MVRCGAANASAMSVTREEVAKIASLARIRMDDAALDAMVPELNNILNWVEQLGEVDTSGGRREDVLANAPTAEHGFFGVPKVIE